MTKVLGKAFGILELVVQAHPMPVSLMDVARTLELNKATCSRLAGELVEMGYLEQRSRYSGFTVGPRAASFGAKARYEEGLTAVADSIVRECAKKLRQSALLAILRQGQRYVLVHHNFNQGMSVELRNLSYADAFNTATGLVLLAYSAPEEFEAAKAIRLDSLSLPWREYGGDAKKDAILAGIRKEGQLLHYSRMQAYPSAVAFPIFKGECFIAAFGVSVPRDLFLMPAQRELIVKEAAKAAKAVSEGLSASASL